MALPDDDKSMQQESLVLGCCPSCPDHSPFLAPSSSSQAPQPGALFCAHCPEGTRSAGGGSRCDPCPPGRFPVLQRGARGAPPLLEACVVPPGADQELLRFLDEAQPLRCFIN